MNLVICNGNKLVFVGKEGCCVVDNVARNREVTLYATVDNVAQFNNFLRELTMTTDASTKSGVNYILDESEYNSSKRRGNLLDVLVVRREVYDAIDVDYSFYDRLICISNEPVGNKYPVEVSTSTDMRAALSYIKLFANNNKCNESSILYNLVAGTGNEVTNYKKRADALLGI